MDKSENLCRFVFSMSMAMNTAADADDIVDRR
jgi:hypothetical protein